MCLCDATLDGDLAPPTTSAKAPGMPSSPKPHDEAVLIEINDALESWRGARLPLAEVEHADVDPDVRLLLLGQSGRYK